MAARQGFYPKNKKDSRQPQRECVCTNPESFVTTKDIAFDIGGFLFTQKDQKHAAFRKSII